MKLICIALSTEIKKARVHSRRRGESARGATLTVIAGAIVKLRERVLNTPTEVARPRVGVIARTGYARLPITFAAGAQITAANK